MDGLRKTVTVLVTVMAVLGLAGIASPAFAQMYGDKGMSNMGMKGMPQTANIGANEKGMPQANVPMGKGMPQTANLGKGMPANIPMGKGMPQTANVAANANMGLGKGMGKGGYGGDMGGYGGADTSGFAGAGAGGAPPSQY